MDPIRKIELLENLIRNLKTAPIDLSSLNLSLNFTESLNELSSTALSVSLDAKDPFSNILSVINDKKISK